MSRENGRDSRLFCFDGAGYLSRSASKRRERIGRTGELKREASEWEEDRM